MLEVERTTNADYVLSEKVAAEIIGVSKATLRREVANGTGPSRVRLSPRRIGYRQSALTEWLARRSVSA